MNNKDYFIRSSGKGEFKTYHLISTIYFHMLDVFFNTDLEAKKYAKEHGLIIAEYDDSDI